MNTLAAASAGLIKWGLLGKILLLSTGISVGLVVLFTLAVNALSAYRRVGASVAAKGTSAVLGVLASALIAATLVWGLYYIVHK